MKTKLLLFMLLTAIVLPDVFSQKGSFWSRIPESIKSRKVFKRFEWDYKQRAFPYDTIPGMLYRQERSREILKSKYNRKPDFDNCEWRPIGPGGVLFDNPWGLSSGRVKAVAVHPTDPNTVYIGAASGGIWKTTTGGATWLDIGKDLESLNFGAIAIDPDNPQTIYAGSGEACLFTFNTMFDGKGLFKSTDGGQSWITINNGFGEYTHFSDIAVNPHNSNIVLASIASGNFFVGDSLPNEGVWKSTDAGLTWNRTLNEEDAYDILFHPVNPAIVYATIGGLQPNSGFYISTNEGNTWTQSNAGLPDPTEIGRMQIDLSHSSPNILYAVIYKPVGSITETTKAFKSVDGGINWAQIAAGIPLGGYNGTEWYDQGWYDLCIAVDPTNPNHVFIGNVELHETFDGSVFSPVRPYGINNTSGSLVHVDYHQLVYAPSDPSYLYIGCDGGIYKSTDGGSTATSLNNGLETLQFYRIASSPFDSLVFMGGMQDNGTAFTQDGGTTWDVVVGSDGMECFFDYVDSTLVYASIQYGALFKSFDGGATFSPIGSCGAGSWITPFFVHPAQHNTLYVATKNIYRMAGIWFQAISYDVVPAPAYVTTIAQSRVNPDHMILASGGAWENYPLTADSLFKVKISTDGGFNWNDVTGNIQGETRWIARVATDPINANTMYVLRTGFSTANKVYKTSDLGISWTNISGDLPDLPTSDIFIDPQNTDHIYVATDIGVYRTIDGGTTWLLQGDGIPFVPVMDFDYVEYGSKRILRIGTHGRSIYETTLDNMVGTGRITNYVLRFTIYPNPSAGSETFSYTLNESSQVTLQIFNNVGQLVAEPVNSRQQKGEQKLEWRSGSLPAGIYYYRIQAGKQVGSGKMVKY